MFRIQNFMLITSFFSNYEFVYFWSKFFSINILASRINLNNENMKSNNGRMATNLFNNLLLYNDKWKKSRIKSQFG